MDGITWERFSKDINEIFERSKEIGDNWELIRAVNVFQSCCCFTVSIETEFELFFRIGQNDDICGLYLRKRAYVELCLSEDVESEDVEFAEEEMLSPVNCESVSNLDSSKQLLSFEYHVLYHLSYAVPYLCFNATKSSELEQSGDRQH